MKKKIFIGSSSKELAIAEEVKKILEADFDVTIWNEKGPWEKSTFRINHNYLADLLEASLKCDFGILIGTSDDVVKFRKKKNMQPRDNILFELGLFIGRLGINNCAFLIEKDIKIPSDLEGITMPIFKKGDSKSLITATEEIKKAFLASCNEINFFPSSTLAVVYFENFIKPTCKCIMDENGLSYESKKYKQVYINILIPNKINDNINYQLHQLKNKQNWKSGEIKCAGRPRTLIVDIDIKQDNLIIYDLPTIVTGIKSAIETLLPNKYPEEYDLILTRELYRFEKRLGDLIKKSSYNDIVKIDYTFNY